MGYLSFRGLILDYHGGENGSRKTGAYILIHREQREPEAERKRQRERRREQKIGLNMGF